MHTFQASRFLLSFDRHKAAIQRLVSRVRRSRQAVCREGLARETIYRKRSNYSAKKTLHFTLALKYELYKILSFLGGAVIRVALLN